MKKNTKIKIIVVLFIILMIALIYIKVKRDYSEEAIETAKMEKIFQNINSTTCADVTKYIVYGTHFNLEGSIEIPKLTGISISKAEVVIEDLEQQEQTIDCDYTYSNGVLSFSTIDEINDGLYLDGLENSSYYIFLKVTFSNYEVNYYSLKNTTQYENVEYYTVTKENSNNKIYIDFETYNDIDYMKIKVSKIDELPEDVYDIVIDPGHGGSDSGSSSGGYTEAEIVLEVGLKLQQQLESLGYKVLITRDETQSDTEDTTTNMYDDDGRVTIANESHAKLLISLHMDSDSYGLSSGGIEVYAPCNCDLSFAKTLADNLVSMANASYSPLNLHKEDDGVYVHNFNETEISALEKTASRNGYEPYDVTTSTPYLYIIRETGGICTNAYVDGRNTNYSANKYYKSNVGIESYLVELGYINFEEDLENVISNEDLYVEAIVAAVNN